MSPFTIQTSERKEMQRSFPPRFNVPTSFFILPPRSSFPTHVHIMQFLDFLFRCSNCLISTSSSSARKHKTFYLQRQRKMPHQKAWSACMGWKRLHPAATQKTWVKAVTITMVGCALSLPPSLSLSWVIRPRNVSQSRAPASDSICGTRRRFQAISSRVRR